MYVECSAITPEKYGALLNSLKNNPDFEVGEACVPAHVISIKLKHDGNVQQQFNGFKNQCFLLTLATNQSDAGAAQGDEGNDAGAFHERLNSSCRLR